MQEPIFDLADLPARPEPVQPSPTTPPKQDVAAPRAKQEPAEDRLAAQRQPPPGKHREDLAPRQPLPDTDLSSALRAAINAARVQKGFDPLADEPVLKSAAQRLADAMVQSIRADPTKPMSPQELHLDDLASSLTGLAQVSMEVVATERTEQLSEKAAKFKAVDNRDWTHLGLGVSEGQLTFGRRFRVAVVLAGRILPGICPKLLNQGLREFSLKCHQCGQKFLARINTTKQKNCGSLSAACPKCHRTVDIYGIDTADRYHRPPWFLRGFRPKKIDSPLEAWLFVLSACRYLDDAKQYRRSEVWQTARQTYRLRQGDCEDTAILLADWLAAAGYKARVVLGEKSGTGHAWTVVRGDRYDYLLETTGGRRNYRRAPPRCTVTADYLPHAQFDRSGIWFRRSAQWTSDYRSKNQWSRGPWPLEPTPATTLQSRR